MSKDQTTDLLKFLSPFSDEVKETVLWLRNFVWDLYPDTNEMIYDNYNALAIGWSPSDRVTETFCSIAVGRSSNNVHFGFYWGSKIADPEKILVGKGNQYRYILVHHVNDFPSAYITKLIKEAYNYSLSRMQGKKQVLKGTTVTKSISEKKRKPGKKLAKSKGERRK